jgi:hypothetical protein
MNLPFPHGLLFYSEDRDSRFLHNAARAQLQCDGTLTGDNFCVWAWWTSSYSLTVNMRSRQFRLLLAARFCIGVACNRLTHSVILFLLHFHPSTGLRHHIAIKLYPSTKPHALTTQRQFTIARTSYFTQKCILQSLWHMNNFVQLCHYTHSSTLWRLQFFYVM